MPKAASFENFPRELRDLVIELTLESMRSNPNNKMVNAAREAMQAAEVIMSIGNEPKTVDTKPEETEITFTEEELKSVGLFRDLLKELGADAHCGNDECTGCNGAFEKTEAEERETKPVYSQIGRFTFSTRPEIAVYRNKHNPSIYGVVQEDRTIILQGGDKFDIPVEVLQQMLDYHGRSDVSLG